jgi:hypothetical protein
MLLLQQGASDWTVVVSAIAAVVSALVALAATIITAQTYAQSRKDKEEELSYKRPKFKLIRDSLEVVHNAGDDYTVNPFYRLTLTFENRSVHPATNIELEGKVLQGDKKLLDFVNRPVGEVNESDTFEVIHNIPKDDVLETASYVRLRLTYKDERTQREYSQLIYRKFYGLHKDVNLTTVELFELDRSEWEDYINTHKNILEAQQARTKELGKKIKEKYRKELEK